MTPLELIALEQLADRLKAAIRDPIALDSKQANNRLDDAKRLVIRAIELLEDGLPF